VTVGEGLGVTGVIVREVGLRVMVFPFASTAEIPSIVKVTFSVTLDINFARANIPDPLTPGGAVLVTDISIVWSSILLKKGSTPEPSRAPLSALSSTYMVLVDDALSFNANPKRLVTLMVLPTCISTQYSSPTRGVPTTTGLISGFCAIAITGNRRNR
jgi:hypothetical protein